MQQKVHCFTKGESWCHFVGILDRKLALTVTEVSQAHSSTGSDKKKDTVQKIYYRVNSQSGALISSQLERIALFPWEPKRV